MEIGIIGSGKIGATAERLFVDTGHELAIANSRGPDSLTDLVQDLGESARPATGKASPRAGAAGSPVRRSEPR